MPSNHFHEVPSYHRLKVQYLPFIRQFLNFTDSISFLFLFCKMKRVFHPIILFTFVSFVHSGCTAPSTLCSRLGFDGPASGGISGCYLLRAQVGGIIGKFRETGDEHGCIVLTSDSLFKEYVNDTLTASRKYSLSWVTNPAGERRAILSFTGEAESIRMGASWTNDSLWVGPVEMFPDAQSSLYVKCCR